MPEHDIHALLAEGRRYVHSGEYEKAYPFFREVLALAPDFSGIHLEIGKMYWERDENDAAIEAAAREIARDPAHKDAHIVMFEGFAALRKDEKYDAALGRVSAVINDLAARRQPMLRELVPEFLRVIEYCNVNGDHDKALLLLTPLLSPALALNSNEKNIVICEQEIAQGRSRVISRGRRLTVQITNRCNLHCKMCNDGKRNPEEISTKVRDELLKLMPYAQEITWLGGEVFLYPYFDMLFSEACKYPVKQHISTNGLLIDEKTAVKLIENNVDLFFSIDGTTAEVYESIRRGARFATLIEKLNMINALQEKIRPDYLKSIKMVVMRSNCHQIRDLVDFARTHKFKVVRYQFMMNPGGIGIDDEDIFGKSRDEAVLARIGKDLEEAERMCRKAGIRFRNNITADVLGAGNPKDDAAPRPRTSDEKRPRFRKCLAPWVNVRIDAHGEVFPHLHFMCTTSVGNLNEENMDAVWNGEKIVRYRETLMSGGIEKICQLVKSYHRVPYEAFN